MLGYYFQNNDSHHTFTAHSLLASHCFLRVKKRYEDDDTLMSAYRVLSLFGALNLYEFYIPSKGGMKQNIIGLVYKGT